MTGVNPQWIAGSNFIMLHVDLVKALDGDFVAALLLDRIRYRAGDGWWKSSHEQMQDDTGLGPAQVKRALKRLRELGWVEAQRTAAYDATMQWRVVVENTEMPEKVETTESTSTKQTPEKVETTESETVETAVSTISKNSENLGKNSLATLDQFEEFWKVYPRKEGKGQARRAWKTAVGKLEPGQLIVAAAEFRQWCEREGKEPRYIKHPSSWLNGECWLDERTSHRAPKSSSMTAIEAFAQRVSEGNR